MGGSGIDLSPLSQLGLVGMFVTLLILFAGQAIKRERDRTDRAEAQVVEATSALREYAVSVTTAIVTVKDLATTHHELVPLLQTLTPTLQEVRRVLDRLDRDRDRAG